MRIFTEQIEQMVADKARHRTSLRYFEGEVPALYMSEQFRNDLRANIKTLRLNHARTVVNALVNRLEVNSIAGATDKANKAIEKVLKQNGKGSLFNELFTTASVFGEAYIMAWPDAKGDWRLTTYDPRTTFIKYSAENPWEKEFAIRVFQDGDQIRLNAFYSDRIVKYAADAEVLDSALNWRQVESVDNPFGEVPFFHLRNNQDHGRPEHFDAFNSQDAINKLVSEHMNTVEYQGAPQRYALANVEQTGEANDFDDDGEERENIEGLKNGPGELWYLKGVSAVGSFNAADPAVFWEPIKDQIITMASLTETPLHYFTGTVLSGPALRAAEAPLIKKAERRQDQYTHALEEMFAFILGVDALKASITINWNNGQAVDVLEEWDILAKKRNVGMPRKQVWKEAGYSDRDIEQIEAWHAEELLAGTDKEYARATPAVRVQEQNDETKIETGEIK